MFQALGPVVQLLQLGFLMAIPIAGGAILGGWLDGQLGTSPWFVLAGLLLGLVLGGVAVFTQIERVFGGGRRR